MISKKKFLGLRPTTQIFKICNELELQRNILLSEKDIDLSLLQKFQEYLSDTQRNNIATDLQDIFTVKDKRLLLEKIHFLYHKLREEAGYTISEKQFIKSSKDKVTSSQVKKNDLVIILENLRSAFNVGSIIRSAECFGVKEIITTGITPQITDNKVIKTAKGTEGNIDFSFVQDISEVVENLKAKDYMIIGAEIGEGSISLSEYKFLNRTAVILGNEEIGLTQKAVDLCDAIVEIDMKGLKNSLNVSNAVSIFMFEYGRQT
ncbi:MAG: hypothetical protein PF638_01905 [Candidatus Delongbacteria bacterium]|jgi:23S rRNA (guanosine2251-2'-O)-methyltransferase|nr:hypothetical protein [Candidatus Delongbacteria bacterium]